jgi:hypothetical protein
MDDKALKLAYASPILAAVVQVKGCGNLDECVDITVSLISKLGAKV